MFEPINVDHDAVVAWAVQEALHVDPEAVARAFVASLSSRHLELRSALGSLALLRYLSPHDFTETESMGCCALCGAYERQATEKLDVLNFERHKWGGVRRTDILYAAFDLSLFRRTVRPEPTVEDWKMLEQILNTARTMQPNDGPSALAKALRNVLPSNQDERRGLVEILAIANVLFVGEVPSFDGQFVWRIDQDHPGGQNDWDYPAIWWRGANGVNAEGVTSVFGGLP